MQDTHTSSLPKISIVIPVYNEEDRITDCLNSLTHQSYDKPYEIIVVDNNSTDSTVQKAKKFPVTIVSEVQKGVAFALNTGCLKASGDIICTTDADTIVPPTWIETYDQFFRAHPTYLAATGPFIYTKESLFMHYVTSIGTHFFPRLLLTTLVGSNMACQKKAFTAVHGFTTSFQLQADSYFGLKISRIGNIGFIKNQIVYSSSRRFTSIRRSLYEGVFRWINLRSLMLFNRGLIKQKCW